MTTPEPSRRSTIGSRRGEAGFERIGFRVVHGGLASLNRLSSRRAIDDKVFGGIDAPLFVHRIGRDRGSLGTALDGLTRWVDRRHL